MVLVTVRTLHSVTHKHTPSKLLQETELCSQYSCHQFTQLEIQAMMKNALNHMFMSVAHLKGNSAENVQFPPFCFAHNIQLVLYLQLLVGFLLFLSYNLCVCV